MRYSIISLVIMCLLMVSLLMPVSASLPPIYDKLFDGYKMPYKVVDVCFASRPDHALFGIYILFENGDLYGSEFASAPLRKILENVTLLRMVNFGRYGCLALTSDNTLYFAYNSGFVPLVTNFYWCCWYW
jgi:hypothetical protein